MHFSTFATVLLAAGAAIAQRSAKPALANGVYTVDGQRFKNRGFWNFGSLRDGAAIPAGLRVSGYPVSTTHFYDPAMVSIKGGYLELKVPGGQSRMPYRGAEVVTSYTKITSASVRTVAVFAESPGVCNGIFYYKNDNQETDIEWLSDVKTWSNNGRGASRKIWFANQDADRDGQKTWTAVAAPSNPTTTEHEYRIDWTPGLVRFFIDGQEKWRTTRDVPNQPGPWVFNNWANGDKGWSCGPPRDNALFKIKEIDIYYN
ncbi:Beta-glucanase [Colletotrichum spinosum]|uniref:Beta-glucanase n=1 Tax=Colletotrichum spinosum TaxID=1347390 RepID=A0A4R8Q8I1_9PEZI|nr:Beta-glucanase [Colletotrichum spinosum]